MNNKILITLFVFLISMMSVLAFNPSLKCKMKKNGWDCSFDGMTCDIDNNNINCELLEMTFGKEKQKIHIYGTEYVSGDNGRIFLQLLDSGLPINNATCLLDLYKPDLTKMLDDAPMMWLNSSDGLYYYDLIIPSQLGVYMLTVKCFYIISGINDYADYSSITNGVVQSGDYKDTWKDDNVFFSITEKLVSGGYSVDYTIEFYNLTIPENYTSLEIYWVGRWDDNSENIKMMVWDYCLSNWTTLSNEITTNTPIVSQYLPSEQYNTSCLINSGELRLRFTDTDQTEKDYRGTVDNDYLYISLLHTSYGQINNIRGSGELHVSRGVSAQINKQDIIEALLENKDILEEHYKKIKNDNYCKDDTTLIHNITYEYCISGSCSLHTYQREERCNYGCSDNRCNPNPIVRILILLAIILSIPLIIWVLSLGGLI